MKSDKIDYRKDVADLVKAQNEGLPICRHDGKPCDTPEVGCEVSSFGVVGSGVVRCPRFRK